MEALTDFNVAHQSLWAVLLSKNIVFQQGRPSGQFFWGYMMFVNSSHEIKPFIHQIS